MGPKQPTCCTAKQINPITAREKTMPTAGPGKLSLKITNAYTMLRKATLNGVAFP